MNAYTVAMLDPAAPPRQLVTSSDLVRHFGYWQDRAARNPVYILHRGRPRLVMTSVEIMDALCAPHFAGSGCGPDLAAVLERIADRVLIADDRHRILAASASARRQFGAAADVGRALGRIVPEAVQVPLAAAIERVSRTGIGVALDVPARSLADRDLTLLIDPWPGGLILVARDAAGERDIAERTALDAAIAATNVFAPARIDLRGRLETAPPALAALCGRHPESLPGTPFAALFEATSQAAVGDAAARVVRHEHALQISALLPGDQGETRPVQVGLAPRRSGTAITGIAAVLVLRAG